MILKPAFIGGDEASIFAGDLFRMYSNRAAAGDWKSPTSEGTSGGFKEIVATISGKECMEL